MGSISAFENKCRSILNSVLWLFFLPVITLVSCSKETIQVEEVTIKPPLKGYKMTARLDNKQSGTSSEAKGLFTGSYSEKTKVLNYKIEFSGLVPKAIEVKKGPRGMNGILVYKLPKNSMDAYESGQQGQKVLTALQERDLIKGNWSVVICTENYPSQEIRGQITLKSE